MLWVNDANGNIETVGRHDRDGHPYDAMNYGYHTDAYGRKLRNRPYNIQDLADQDGDYAQDIPQMAYQPNGIVDPQDASGTINSANNFSYDALGQRTRDEKADIELIEWTAARKMKRVQHTTASGKPDIRFAYDASGNRIMKQVGDPDVDPTGYREWYVPDAQGNIMAVYRYTNTGPKSLKVAERPVYGSKRLGSYTRAMELVGEQTIINYPYTQPMQAPLKRYELTDHLGNVATVVTGRLLPLLGPGVQYQAEVVSATLHEPFGLELTGMNWQSGTSRWGFQNQEQDRELNSVHFKYREYSPPYGFFDRTDPLWAKYPYWSPYAFSGNRVIDMIELEGLEPEVTSDKLKAMGDQNSAWGFGARGNENTNWQQNINGQDYQTYQCSDCFTGQGNKEGTGLAGNALMWGKVPSLAQGPTPTGTPGTTNDPLGGNVPTDRPVLGVPAAPPAGVPTPPLNTPVNFAGRFQGNDNTLTGGTADAANAQLGQIGAYLAANPNARVDVTINTNRAAGDIIGSSDPNNRFAGIAVDKRGGGPAGLLQGRSQTIQQGLNAGFGGAVPNGQVNFIWQTGQSNTNTSVTVRP